MLFVIIIVIVAAIIIYNCKFFSPFLATSQNSTIEDTWNTKYGVSDPNKTWQVYGFDIKPYTSNIPIGPYLIQAPGWTEPISGQTPSIIAATVTYLNTLGIPSITSNISAQIGMTWPNTNGVYYYSPTNIAGIPNNYLYSVVNNGITTITSSIVTRPLLNDSVGDSTGTTFKGPADTTGEYAAFNAYFQYDLYANMFMDNDANFTPFTVDTSYKPTAIDISKPGLKGVSYYLFYDSKFTTGDSKKYQKQVFTGNEKTLSYNMAIGIPADFAIEKYDTATNAINIGTPGYAMNSLTNPSYTKSQDYRSTLISGVLIAIHSLISSNINQLPGGPLKNYTSDILGDFEKYYPAGSKCTPPAAQRLTGFTPFYVSNNTSHAIYLTLMARDTWINNQLTNIILL